MRNHSLFYCMNYGTPYKGSKSRIAPWVVDHLPVSDTLMDLFAGGCAVTDCAMRQNKYGHYIVNDINGQPKLFEDAVKGKYASEKRWISREDFYRLKDSDQYIRACWSFSNNGENYLYAQEIEPWEKAVHYARVLGDPSLLEKMGIHSDGSRADIKAHHDEYKELYIRWWLSQQKYTPAELDELIAKCNGNIAKEEEELRNYLLDALHKSGLTQAEVQRRLGTQMSGHYFGRSQWTFPTQEMYERMQTFMPLPTDYNELVGLYRLRQSLESLQRLQRLQRLQSLESLQSLQRLESLQSLESLERLQRLQRLQSLQSLQSLESLQSLQSLQSDYKDVAIPDGAVVYADPPYRGTDCSGYSEFDFDRFDGWLRSVDFMVIVSEYVMPDDFVCVAEAEKILRQIASQKAVKKEKLWVHQKWVEEYYKRMSA